MLTLPPPAHHSRSAIPALAAAAFLIASLHAVAFGQEARSYPLPAPAGQLPGDTCPPPPLDKHELAPLLEKLLAPGQTFSIADIPPAQLAKLATVQKLESERQTQDWPNLCKYRQQNAELAHSGGRARVVFLGDSITENWQAADPGLFTAGVLDRGISGQTTPQILLRCYADVVALHPRVVHIMAGTNDVAGNTGPVSDATMLDNIAAMIDIARANNIKVVLASIPPAKSFPWRGQIHPATRIRELNQQLRQLAAKRHVVYVDYQAALSDAEGGMPASLANDGVHPNRDGYALMRPLAERAIAQALRR
jgi:lysophospholipase L1-like esterase